MRSKEEIQQAAIARAREFADRRGFKGGGYELVDYKKSLSELPPEERERERGLPADGDDGQVEPTQRQRASQHFAERITHYTKQGYTHARAIELAKDEERASGLHQTRANLPKGSIWAAAAAQEQRDETHRFSKLTGARAGEITVKTHAARPGPLSSIEAEKLRTMRPTLVKQVAADCLYRNRTEPDHFSWLWTDRWFGANFPPPAPTPGAGPATIPGSRPGSSDKLADYNLAREQFLDQVIEAARVILRDPQASNLLRPTPLGS